MPHSLFNGACDECKHFRPRCATVEWTPPRAGKPALAVLCDECRKALRGRFRLHERHQGKKP